MFSYKYHLSKKRMSALRKTTTNISEYLRQTKDADDKRVKYTEKKIQ